MENIFNCLCSALAEPEMKQSFLESEGVELMIIMMKWALPSPLSPLIIDYVREKLLARTRSIKVLDYAMQTEDGTGNCERFVEMLGLKIFFSAFMGKVGRRHPLSLAPKMTDCRARANERSSGPPPPSKTKSTSSASSSPSSPTSPPTPHPVSDSYQNSSKQTTRKSTVSSR